MSESPARRGMVVRHGVHKEVEAAADEILRQALSGITRHADKSDVLTPWKETSRRSREVYVPSGTPDASLRRGSFGRAWNPSAPHLNSVEGSRPIRHDTGPSDTPTTFTGPSWDNE